MARQTSAASTEDHTGDGAEHSPSDLGREIRFRIQTSDIELDRLLAPRPGRTVGGTVRTILKMYVAEHGADTDPLDVMAARLAAVSSHPAGHSAGPRVDTDAGYDPAWDHSSGQTPRLGASAGGPGSGADPAAAGPADAATAESAAAAESTAQPAPPSRSSSASSGEPSSFNIDEMLG